MLTPAGAAYVIDSPPFAGVRPLAERPAAHLWQRLQLVYGVGPVTESELRAQGYGDLRALCNHPRWGARAREVVEYINNRDIPRLRLAGARDSELLSFFAPHEIAAMDIETAGFARALPVFIVGVAWSDGQNWYIRQFIARQFDEEGGVLYLASKFLSDYPALVSYNGRAFDEPFVGARLLFHGIPRPSFALHYDIYQEVRQLRAAFDNCRLSTVARHIFDSDRGEDIPGRLVPELYYRYVQDRRHDLLLPIIEHNAKDLKDLCRLLDVNLLFPGDREWLKKAVSGG
ncbi:MAG: ribonuclease H-like domain-containing protein [Firmicutes bacterium]|jgi:uncharacterized protein YprB with RNaseH-like and TPR domain|nr:ribonuclease H-like domain-containing protein [Bacillota bacterium]